MRLPAASAESLRAPRSADEAEGGVWAPVLESLIPLVVDVACEVRWRWAGRVVEDVADARPYLCRPEKENPETE